MSPILLLVGAGAAAFFFMKGKKASSPGPAPVFVGTATSRTVQGKSGFLYQTEVYPADAGGNVRVTVQAVGFTQNGQTTQIPANTNWLAYSQNNSTGKRTWIAQGTQATPSTLTDFAVS